jgi:hypothetical protein
MSKVREIKGVITLTDGTTSEFRIGIDAGWQQWGASQERLAETSAVMDALVYGLTDDDLLASSNDEDEDDAPTGVCQHCGAAITQDAEGSWVDDIDGDGCDDVPIMDGNRAIGFRQQVHAPLDV